VDVDVAKCVGCGICVALAPAVMGLDANEKAFARTRVVEWSPADGGFVHECPTRAISAVNVDRRGSSNPVEQPENMRDPSPSGAGGG
jgi:ferredoxin